MDVRKQIVKRVNGHLRVGGGVIMGRKKVCFKMHFRQNKVFLEHVFFFFLMENQVIGDPPTHP